MFNSDNIGSKLNGTPYGKTLHVAVRMSQTTTSQPRFFANRLIHYSCFVIAFPPEGCEED